MIKDIETFVISVAGEKIEINQAEMRSTHGKMIPRDEICNFPHLRAALLRKSPTNKSIINHYEDPLLQR